MTKPFALFLAAALVLGISLGGAFAGGVALGKSQSDQTVQVSPTAPSIQQRTSGQTGQGDLDQVRQRLQSGEISPQDLDQTHQRFQGRLGSDGLTGTIELVEGNRVTLRAPEGPILVTIGDDTSIQKLAAGAVADLKEGDQVVVIGRLGEDGTMQAGTIVLTPPGVGGLFGGGVLSGEPSSPR